MECFRDAVLGQPADMVTFAQGARTVAVANACARSAATRQAIDVEV